MHITPTNYNTNFDGKIYIKGNWTPVLQESFQNSASVKKIAEQKDVIGYMKTSTKSIYHPKGQKTYKLYLSVVDEKPSLWTKLKLFLGLNKKTPITRNYHSKETTIEAIENNIKPSKFLK